MKKIGLFAVAALALVLTSCGGYSNEKAKEYTQKLKTAIEKGEKLSQDEYIEMNELWAEGYIETGKINAKYMTEEDETKASELEKQYEEIDDCVDDLRDALRAHEAADFYEDETLDKVNDIEAKARDEREKIVDEAKAKRDQNK